jgi:hypothetical protein
MQAKHMAGLMETKKKQAPPEKAFPRGNNFQPTYDSG